MASKPKRGGYHQRDPSGIALGELHKSLEKYPDVDIPKRQAYLDEMKDYPFLTNINMLMVAGCLVLLDKISETQNFIEHKDAPPDDLIFTFFQVGSPDSPGITERVPGKNYNHILPMFYNNQDLYDYVTYPILSIINEKEIPSDQVPEILIKTRGTLYQYSMNLIKYRTPVTV